MRHYNLIVSHQDQVTKLPDNAELIAGSEFCPVGMFQMGGNILAIQGHPEFNKDYAEALMRHRRKLLGETVFSQGIRSLQSPINETGHRKVDAGIYGGLMREIAPTPGCGLSNNSPCAG